MASVLSEEPSMVAAIQGAIGRSWMFIAFFIGFFLFWEYSVVLFDIPRYILTPPSEVVRNGWADLDRLLYYTYVTGLETLLGYLVAVVIALPLVHSRLPVAPS